MRVDDQRRVHLLQHVAVLLEQQPEELLGVVRDQIQLEVTILRRGLDRLPPGIEPDDLPHWQDVAAPQVVVRVGRREAVEVRPTDRGEDERVGVMGHHPPQPLHRLRRHEIAHSRSFTRSSSAWMFRRASTARSGFTTQPSRLP